MAEGKEPLGPSGVNTVGVTVPEKDATVGDVARAAAGCDDMVVRPGEPCYRYRTRGTVHPFYSQWLRPLRSAHLVCQRSRF